MEIKTSKEIIDTQCSTWGKVKDLEKHLNKKWVSVDDLIEYLDSQYNSAKDGYKDFFIDEIKEQLNTSVKEE